MSLRAALVVTSPVPMVSMPMLEKAYTLMRAGNPPRQ
jgi:hypothetical protein